MSAGDSERERDRGRDFDLYFDLDDSDVVFVELLRLAVFEVFVPLRSKISTSDSDVESVREDDLPRLLPLLLPVDLDFFFDRVLRSSSCGTSLTSLVQLRTYTPVRVPFDST